MQLLDWPLLDALQAGALLTLFISFITEALQDYVHAPAPAPVPPVR